MTKNLKTLNIGQLTFGSIFKILFWSGMLFWGLISLFAVLMAFIAPDSITINGQQAANTMEALSGVPFVLLIGGLLSIFVAGVSGGLLRLVAPVVAFGNIEYQDFTAEDQD